MAASPNSRPSSARPTPKRPSQTHPKTVLVYEYPQAEGDPYYPILMPENAALYDQYHKLAETTPHVYFVGRLATYKYYNMYQVVVQALILYKKLTAPTQIKGHAVAASNENPEFLVETKGGKRAAHKDKALTRE